MGSLRTSFTDSVQDKVRLLDLISRYFNFGDMLIEAFNATTFVAFEMNVIVVVFIGITGIMTQAVGSKPTVIRNFVQNTVFRKRVKGSVQGDAIVSGELFFQVFKRKRLSLIHKEFKHIYTAVCYP